MKIVTGEDDYLEGLCLITERKNDIYPQNTDRIETHSNT